MLKNLKRFPQEHLGKKKHLSDLQIWHTFELRKRKNKQSLPSKRTNRHYIYTTKK